MRGEFYLVLRRRDKPPNTLGGRLTDRKPTLEPGELVVRLKVELPDVLFAKPTLEAKISIPASRAMPTVIDADVVENIADTLKANLGLDLNIIVEEVS